VAALTAMLAWTGSLSADIVASHAGPTTFDGVDDTVVLDNVSIGLEGTVSLDFKANTTATPQSIWYLADSPGGTTGEYRIGILNNSLNVDLWTDSGSPVGWGTPFTDTSSWHSVAVTWKEGEKTQITLDGATTDLVNSFSLKTFASTTGNHALGVNTSNGGIRFFDGQIANVVVTNAYSPVPEPSTIMLLTTGLVSLLAYAWRKRR
jgi:hypothetical protein